MTRHALVTLIGTGTTMVSTYVFQVLMARWLSTLAYGELSSIVAALNIVTIPIFGLSMAVTREVAASLAQDEMDLRTLLRPYATRALALTAVLVAGGLLASPWLLGFLQLSSPGPLLFLAVLVALTNLVAIGRAVVVGLHDFTRAAFNQVAEGVLRLLGAGVAASLGVTSAGFIGYTIGLIVALFLLLPRSSALDQNRRSGSLSIPMPGPRERDISWSAILVTGTFILLLNMDLIVVKHFLSPEEAGQYAAISTLGKVLFVVTNAFDLVLFPLASAARATGADQSAQLRRAIRNVAIVVAPTLAVYGLLAEPLINGVFGLRYVLVAPLLAPYSLGITLLGLATLLARYRLAVGRGVQPVLLLVLVGAAVLGFALFHGTLGQIVGVVLVVGVLSLGALAAGHQGQGAADRSWRGV